MKLGLISDIHADPESLLLALRLLRGKGAGKILCAGDLVDKGPGGNQVVELICTEGIPTVAGNHDQNAERVQAFYRTDLGALGVSPNMLLTDRNIEYLAKLPEVIYYPAAGHTVMVTHGTPWNISEYLYPASREQTFRRVAHDAKKEGANILILGHTHTPMAAFVDGVHIFNPGSVCGGHYASGSRSVGMLDLPSLHFEVFDIDTGQPIPCAAPIFGLPPL